MNLVKKINKSALFLILIFLIVIAVITFIVLSLHEDPVEEKLKNDPVVPVLFVIHDNQNECLATDIFFYSTKTGKAALFDILGNTGSIFQSIGRVDRIDAVYSEKGIEVYKQEIENLVNQDIPFTIEISLEDLGVLTDFLGGLKVFVPSPVDFVQTYTAEDGFDESVRWLLPSGAVTLDGDKIQTFVKYVHPDEDSRDVEDRRQNALIALFTGIKENRNTVFNKKNFNFFADRFVANMDKNGLKKILSNITNIETERLTPTVITGTTRIVDGQELLFPYYNGQLIKEVVDQAITSIISGDSSMQNGGYVLIIQNGTSRRGLARNTSFLMQSAGYDVLEAVNADRNDYEHTLIISHGANQQAAQALADFIKCKNIRTDEFDPADLDSDNSARSDFTIIIGDDFDGRYVKGGYKPQEADLQTEQQKAATDDVKSQN